ncbi:MAG: hypothetical protein GSR77_04645 [Desulfurococcales archaeon]|nr:hypothetical protein [Desulfurococcales archaeon]
MNNKYVIIASLGLLAVLTLTMVGPGLTVSHWNDQVKIEGSMSTGSLEWDITPTGLSWNTNTVMHFDAGVRASGDGPGQTGIIGINLVNAYPNGYGAYVFQVRNEGTIPVHVTFWFETGTGCPGDLADYILVNPVFDAPFYNGEFDLLDYSIASIHDGWTSPYTRPLSWWLNNVNSMSTAMSLESNMESGTVLYTDTTSTTIMQYDTDNILMPGEKTIIFVWIGISDELQQHEEYMGESCGDAYNPAFYIHYYAVQALP